MVVGEGDVVVADGLGEFLVLDLQFLAQFFQTHGKHTHGIFELYLVVFVAVLLYFKPNPGVVQFNATGAVEGPKLVVQQGVLHQQVYVVLAAVVCVQGVPVKLAAAQEIQELRHAVQPPKLLLHLHPVVVHPGNAAGVRHVDVVGILAGLNVPRRYLVVERVGLLPLLYHFVGLRCFGNVVFELVEVKIREGFDHVFFVYQRQAVVPHPLQFIQRGVVEEVFLGGVLYAVVVRHRFERLDFFEQVVVQHHRCLDVVANDLQVGVVASLTDGWQPVFHPRFVQCVLETARTDGTLRVAFGGNFQEAGALFVVAARGDGMEHAGGFCVRRVDDVPLFVGLLEGAGEAAHLAAFDGGEGNLGDLELPDEVRGRFRDDVGTHQMVQRRRGASHDVGRHVLALAVFDVEAVHGAVGNPPFFRYRLV